MTTIICWAACDKRGVSSIYLGSDSRISWKDDDLSKPKPDSVEISKKVFTTYNSADMFAYEGDVVSATTVITAIISRLNNGTAYSVGASARVRSQIVYKLAENAISEISKERRGRFKIVYVTRAKSNLESDFAVSIIENREEYLRPFDPVTLPMNESGVVFLSGSGKETLRERILHIRQSVGLPPVGNDAKFIPCPSRYIFMALIEAISSGKDRATNAVPQLAGINRKFPAQEVGVLIGRVRYLGGLRYESSRNLKRHMWVNELFEVCSWHTMKKKANFQKHERP